MSRTVKDPDVRRHEILTTASELFRTRGYKRTSVDAIVEQVGVAKGTFYYYFKSKKDVLAALVQQLVADMADKARAIAGDPNLNALQKIGLMLHTLSQAVTEADGGVMENLHLPENRELHERSNVETVLVFGPIMAEVVEQGNRERIFNAKSPLESVQFILAGSQFLFDSGLFNWTEAELVARRQAMQAIIECALGAEPGVFGFLSGN